jgi:hypothetical protein
MNPNNPEFKGLRIKAGNTERMLLGFATLTPTYTLDEKGFLKLIGQ